MSDVGASLRRHWPVALVVLVLIPLVVAIYLGNRVVVRPPARYTTSADVLIPARDAKTGDSPSRVPPVLLQGQLELALSRNVKDVTLQASGLDPEVDHSIGFSAKLSPNSTIMTLSVAAPKPEVAKAVLDEYVVAYEDGRRQSVLDAAVERADVEVKTIGVLTRRIADVEFQLGAMGISPPPTEDDGALLQAPPGASSDAVLLIYQRNALINEMQRRRVDYSLQITQAAIPGDYTTVVQRRSAARVTPPPPSPLIPLLEIIGIGLLLSIAIPVLFDRFDATITEPRAAPGAFRARLLATIPYMPRRLHEGYAPPGSTWDAAFRSLAATSISTDELPTAIMVSCPVGSTQDTVAANFAVGLASLGVTVALVGTVPRQDWYLHDALAVDDGGSGSRRTRSDEAAADATEEEPVVYVDVDAVEADESTDGGADSGDEPGTEGAPEEPIGGQDVPTGWGVPTGRPAPPPEPDEAGASGTYVRDVYRSAVEEERAPVTVGAAPSGAAPGAELPEVSFDGVPTFPELLEVAQAGRLPRELRSCLGTRGVPNLYVVPPGDGTQELVLDGLPPLLDALSRDDIDITVIAGPALLEDPNATIIAWSTRHVLWTVEIGRVNTRDAQLSADRLELAGVAPFGLAIVNRHA